MQPMRRWLVLAGLALGLTLGPSGALAQSAEDPVEDGADKISIPKLLDYTTCALSILMIETGVGAAFAAVSCTRALNNWFEK